MRYPKDVPILEAHHLCKGSYGTNDIHCLSGWMYEVFQDGLARADASRAIKQVAGADRIVEFNDAPGRKLSFLAKTWNRAMAVLGYTEGNPEKAWVEKHEQHRS